MSTPHLIMWAIVALVGFPAAVRNPTALGLVCAWLAGEITWLATGNNLPLSVYIVADIAVMTVIFAKAIVRAGPKLYPTVWLQLKCMFLDLTVWDRFIAGLFLFGAWPVYASGIHPYYQWWALYYITIGQFIFAAMEPLVSRHLRRKAKRHVEQNNILHFVPAYSRRVKRYFGAEPPPSHSVEQHSRAEGHG